MKYEKEGIVASVDRSENCVTVMDFEIDESPFRVVAQALPRGKCSAQFHVLQISPRRSILRSPNRARPRQKNGRKPKQALSGSGNAGLRFLGPIAIQWAKRRSCGR